ncbi:MAG: toprim domain-containing protein [Anaerolineae bacterium]|nr:toprim domain-containing protein [Anaerolineae bacterium]
MTSFKTWQPVTGRDTFFPAVWQTMNCIALIVGKTAEDRGSETIHQYDRKTRHAELTGFGNVSLSHAHFGATGLKRQVKPMEKVDTWALKALHDLRLIVEQDLGPAPVRSGRACLWKCPFHSERQGYSLVVWANGYRCFGKCQIHGDVFDWLQHYRQLDFREAVEVLGQVDVSVPPASVARAIPVTAPPSIEWQTAARQVVEQAEEWLWDAPGEGALAYLLEKRGLTGATIRTARLGVVTGGYREWLTMTGLNVPCGITIPWFTGETLWAVKVRRLAGHIKYQQIAGGSSSGLYRGDALAGARAALFCEGEFDALVAHQEAADLVAAVSLGSAGNTLSDRWIIDLVTVPLILVAYDADPAGLKGAARLQSLSDRVHTIQVPQGKDITEFYQQSEEGAVFDWLARELRQARQQAIFRPDER